MTKDFDKKVISENLRGDFQRRTSLFFAFLSHIEFFVLILIMNVKKRKLLIRSTKKKLVITLNSFF